jgi:hypothetical protein
MEKIVTSAGLDKSQIIPAVTLRIPMPQGAAVPAQPAPQPAQAQSK